jgi:hypothetical protein
VYKGNTTTNPNQFVLRSRHTVQIPRKTWTGPLFIRGAAERADQPSTCGLVWSLLFLGTLESSSAFYDNQVHPWRWAGMVVYWTLWATIRKKKLIYWMSCEKIETYEKDPRDFNMIYSSEDKNYNLRIGWPRGASDTLWMIFISRWFPSLVEGTPGLMNVKRQHSSN